MRKWERNSSAVSEDGGGGGAPDMRTEVPLQPMERTMLDQAVPLQLMLYYVREDINTAAIGGPHTTAGGYGLKESAAHGEPQDQTQSQNCSP